MMISIWLDIIKYLSWVLNYSHEIENFKHISYKYYFTLSSSIMFKIWSNLHKYYDFNKI